MNSQSIAPFSAAPYKNQILVAGPATWGLRGLRVAGLCLLVLLAAWSILAVYLLSSGERFFDALLPVTTWRIENRVDSTHPLILSWANDIRTITSDQREQAALAEETVWQHVRYWNTHDEGENDFIPTIDEMVERAQSHDWETLRGNCVSESVMLCSLLRSLGISAQIKTSPVHAWVEFQSGGKTLCTLLPELSLSREADLPKSISRPEALAAMFRLGADTKGVFHDPGLLPDSRSEDIPHFRSPGYLILALPILAFWFMVLQVWDATTTVAIARSRKVSIRIARQKVRLSGLNTAKWIGAT